MKELRCEENDSEHDGHFYEFGDSLPEARNKERYPYCAQKEAGAKDDAKVSYASSKRGVECDGHVWGWFATPNEAVEKVPEKTYSADMGVR